MPDLSWFKLAVRGIGILFLGLGVPSAANAVVAIALNAQTGGFGGQNTLILYAGYAIGPVAQSVFGFYLLFHGDRLIAFCIRGVLGHCSVCGYDLRGVSASVCPECGCQEPGGMVAAIGREPGVQSTTTSGTPPV